VQRLEVPAVRHPRPWSKEPSFVDGASTTGIGCSNAWREVTIGFGTRPPLAVHGADAAVDAMAIAGGSTRHEVLSPTGWAKSFD